MSVSRRSFLVLSMGVIVAGCTNRTGPSSSARSDHMSSMWPDSPETAGRNWGGVAPAPRLAPQTRWPTPQPAPQSPIVTPQPAQPAPAPGVVPAPGAVTVAGINAIPRSKWAEAAPMMSKINPMDGVNRITVHHEGWTPVYFTDVPTVTDRLERIRKAHLQRLSAGDIGYHFVIDRAGRVWQGRDLRYQGAHVKAQNEHNVGVMVMGNFDNQSPTDAQVTALRDTLSKLMKYYKVPVNKVYTHRELNPTDCPGEELQPKMVSLRRGNALA